MVILHNSFLYEYDFFMKSRVNQHKKDRAAASCLRLAATRSSGYGGIKNGVLLSDSVILAQELLEVGAFDLLQRLLQGDAAHKGQLHVRELPAIPQLHRGIHQRPDVIGAAPDLPARPGRCSAAGTRPPCRCAWEYSVVKMVSRPVSANWPRKAKFTASFGTMSGRSLGAGHEEGAI